MSTTVVDGGYSFWGRIFYIIDIFFFLFLFCFCVFLDWVSWMEYFGTKVYSPVVAALQCILTGWMNL